MIRPRAARWFELLVARDDTTLALEALAATGAVELETRSGATLPPSFDDLRPLLQRFRELGLRYGAYWPQDDLHPSVVPEPPTAALQRCVTRLEAWAIEAEPLIRTLQDGDAELADLARWQCVFEHLDDGLIDLAQAAQAGPPLLVRLAVAPAAAMTTPPHSTLAAASDAAIVRHFVADGWHHALAVGSAAQLQALEQLTAAAKGRWVAPPAWLQRDREQNRAVATARVEALSANAQRLRSRLAALADAHGLRGALGDARRLQWVIDNVHGLEVGELFCWVTGWTSTLANGQGGALEAAIERSGARALLRFPRAPRGAHAPMLLANPAWARPFEVFARSLGMPSSTEADPSVMLALAVPLMFGYMFGDVGQGLVIAAAGFVLRRRFALARLFIAGGLSSVLFGFLFGSVFSLHTLHALWIEPLEDPLAVLAVPVVGGALLLTMGLLLSALGAYWRGELGAWLVTDVGYVVAYLGLVASALWPPALAVAAAGAVLFCAGHAAIERRALAALAAAGELVERLLQILLNTLSFARVGAFALAHAGLSAAVVALMDAAPSAFVAGAVLVAGNVVVIALEGLVVSIQTTRLVLFEFFTRFLQGQGRVFRPLPLPPSTLQET